MPERRLLYLDASHLGAFLWQGGSLREEERFAAGEEGVAAFGAYLRRHRTSNFSLLVDIAEEGFQSDVIPYTQGADRRAMLGRKLGQFFYGSPLAAAISLGREKSGRRDEKILFTALTQPQLIEPWLEAMRAAETQLAGVFSLPLLGTQLLAKIQSAPEQCLLVALTSSGVRQSFLEGGRILFSRLTPHSASTAAEAASACADESVKTYQYLLGQRLLARGTPLPVIVLTHPAHMAEFADRCRSTEYLQFRIADLHALCRSCGLKTPPQDSRSDALFLHLLAQRRPREQFAPAAELRFFRLWQIRSALTGAGAVALLGCLLFAGKQFYEGYGLRGRSGEMRALAAADAERYAAIQKTFPPMPTSTDNLRLVINRYEEIEKRSATPEPLYLSVSRGLQDAPRVDLERIDWLLSANPDEGAQAPDARKSAAAAVPAEKPGTPMHAIAIVHGTLPVAMAGDQRGQLDAINGFVAALRQDAALKVTILRLPFDIESGKSLKSGGEKASEAVQPKFTVHISRRL